MGTYRIGEISKQLGLSIDTLRYYERIGLLPKVARTASGIRIFSDRDLSRLNFIRRAQAMNFTLDEIADLLKMREDPRNARQEARELTRRKLAEVEAQLKDLEMLRNEFQLLLNLCAGAQNGCPIIEAIDQAEAGTPPSATRNPETAPR